MSQLLMKAGIPWLHKPKVILDLGARNCQESIAFAKWFPDAKVFAFECNPESLAICHGAANAYRNITIVPKAVHETTGHARFYQVQRRAVSGFSPNDGASSLFRASGHMETEPILQTECLVECIRIDDWAMGAGIDAIDAIWMDIQGAELLALKGMGRLVESVKVVFTEVTYRELYAGQAMYKDVDEFLNEAGFRQEYHEPAVTIPDWFGEAVYVRR